VSVLGYGDPREWLEAGGNEGGPLFGCGQHRSDEITKGIVFGRQNG